MRPSSPRRSPRNGNYRTSSRSRSDTYVSESNCEHATLPPVPAGGAGGAGRAAAAAAAHSGSNTPQQQSDVEKKQGTLDEPEDAIVRFGRTVPLLPSPTPAVRPLNCANQHECGAVNLRQSEFLITPLRLRDWKGDFWGHCFACSEYTDGNEFRRACKKRNRWRLKAVGCFRFREREVRFMNVLHQVEGELPGLSRSRIREIAVARSRAIAVAWSRGPSRAGR